MIIRAIVCLGLASVLAIVLAIGCTDLECDPEAMEVDGMCICRTGFMLVGDRCVSETDTGMNDGGPDTGEVDDAGTDAPMACGGACMGATPHCDTDTDTCVACLGDSHCDETAPVCGAGGVCGPCTGPADCSEYPDAPVCGDSGAVDGTCVACAGDSDCTDADTGKCDTGTNTCVPCDDSDQCTEDGAGVCDMTGESGVCVECTIETEGTACEGTSCNPATSECTETEVDTVPDCGRCVADSECANEDDRCVPMNFMGTPLDNGFCLRLESASCARPYVTSLITAVSLSGEPETTYCGIDQTAVTCDAVRALRSSAACPGGVAECAAQGARCERIGATDDLCTYECGVANQCPSGLTCGVDYCGS